MTYGYQRSEIIASLCSSLITLVLSMWIVSDSIELIKMPRNINSVQMLFFSILGVIFSFILRYIKDLDPVPDSDEGKFFKTLLSKIILRRLP